ncbi:acetyltransferase [Clostridia bacterium]|nr:acetyltransferase [Clostridia bacterium]
MQLETQRLIIREYKESDIDAVFAYGGNAENMFYMYIGMQTYEDEKNFVKETMQNSTKTPRTDYSLLLTEKTTGKVIGGMGLMLNSELNQAELGYVLHKDYWGKGYATEAAKKFVQFGFKTLNLHRIYAKCDSENYASYHIMEKLNMRREGNSISCRLRWQTNQWADDYTYAILAEEYK